MHGFAVGTVRIVERIVVDVVERISRPIAVEAHALGPPFVGPAVGVVPVDLADIAGLVAGIGEHVGQRPVIGIEVQLVDHHARRRGVFARYQAGPVGGADRADRHGVGEIERLAREPVEVGVTANSSPA